MRAQRPGSRAAHWMHGPDLTWFWPWAGWVVCVSDMPVPAPGTEQCQHMCKPWEEWLESSPAERDLGFRCSSSVWISSEPWQPGGQTPSQGASKSIPSCAKEGVLIHFSIGQHQPGPKARFVSSPLCTGLVSLFRWLWCICRLQIMNYMIPSDSHRLGTFILDLILQCYYIKQTVITKYFDPWPKSDSPVVCLGARSNWCFALLPLVEQPCGMLGCKQTEQNHQHQHRNSLPADSTTVSFCFRRGH